MTFYWLSEWVKSLSPVWLFATPWTVSLPGSSVHGIFQARALEWAAIPFSRGSPRPRDRTRVSHIVGRRFTVWASGEVLTEYFLGKKRTLPSVVLCGLAGQEPPSSHLQTLFEVSVHYFFTQSWFPSNHKNHGCRERFHDGILAALHLSISQGGKGLNSS